MAEGYGEAQVQPDHVTRYESLVRNQIKPHIGGIKLAKLQPVQINHLMGEIARDVEERNNGRSPAWSQKMALTLLSNALRHAVRLRLISHNPAADIPKAKPREKEIEFLTAEQGKKFLEAAKTKRLYALFAVALGTGMRQGEILALRWDTIDFEREQLTRAAFPRRCEIEVHPEGAEEQAEPPDAQAAGIRRRRTQVSPRRNGEGISQFAVLLRHQDRQPHQQKQPHPQIFRPILKAAKLARVKFHALRHSHARHCSTRELQSRPSASASATRPLNCASVSPPAAGRRRLAGGDDREAVLVNVPLRALSAFGPCDVDVTDADNRLSMRDVDGIRGVYDYHAQHNGRSSWASRENGWMG